MRSLRRADETPVPYAAAWALEGSTDTPLVLPSLLDSGALVASGVPVLWFGAPAAGNRSLLLSRLPQADQTQVRCLRNLEDQWSVGAARTAVRMLLGQCLGCAAQDVAVVRDERGKPHLDPRRHGILAERVHFSISHARGLVAVAIGHSRIGVDVEEVRGFADLVQVAGMQFAPEMLRDLEALRSDAERAALFYRFWTLGEAFIKATGEGIAQELRSFAFSARGDPALTRVDAPWGPRNRWRFGTLNWGPTSGAP